MEPTGLRARLESRGLALWSGIPTPLRVRIIPMLLALGTGIILGLSAWLSPDPQGHATHLQLGLSPCTILSATGYACPMCGATTTFALWAHARPLDALVNQPFASLLFWMTLGTFGISVAELLDPRRRWERLLTRLAPYETLLVGAFVVFLLISWVYKIWLMGGAVG